MACPQCGAEVPSDDAFCGKCGYAMREGTPERVDQSRIRVYEEPDPIQPSTPGSSEPRIRKATMVGMPAMTPSKSPPTENTDEATPPTEISAARERAKKRAPQKTMIGVPRPDLPPPVALSGSEDFQEPSNEPPDAPCDSGRPARKRARVRYDSINESFPMVQRRKKALRGLAVLVLLAGAWFVYRFLTLNG